VQVSVVESLADVPAADWDALAGDHPFLLHGFLHGLETTDCLAPQGWYPQHLLAHEDGRLVGALPLYLRDNSYGEFVLVSAIPFSPVTGPRLLTHPTARAPGAIASRLVETAREACAANGLSSWHCLFPPDDELPHYRDAGLLARLGCQYHWFNRDYADFDAFLAALNSKKRKQIKRERRLVAAHDLVIETVVGPDITPAQWSVFHRFYCSTFERKWGEPRLTEDFFQSLDRFLPGRAVLILARAGARYVAGAFALLGDDTLYGRHWGASAHYDNLHFELCYYRTIDFCINRRLARLDAGAQGEHKLARGFVPVTTWSVHWVQDAGFRRAVADFLERERMAMDHHMNLLSDHVAFRHE
jgi:uncharacterized protein